MGGTVRVVVSQLNPRDLLLAKGVAIVSGLLIANHVLRRFLRIVYNLYFHLRSRYPGPKLWVAFDLGQTIGCMGGSIDFQITEIHRKHG